MLIAYSFVALVAGAVLALALLWSGAGVGVALLGYSCAGSSSVLLLAIFLALSSSGRFSRHPERGE